MRKLCTFVLLWPQSPRAKFLRNFSKRSAKNAAKFWRNFSQIFVLQFPGKMAAKIFTKNPRHFPRCTKLSFFTAATLGASGPSVGIPPTPDRAPNPHFLEKRAPGSKNPHFPSPSHDLEKGVFCQKSPVSLCSLVEKRGFFDRKLPFPDRGEMGVFGPGTLPEKRGILFLRSDLAL